jgi:hypothetical protein
MHLIETVHPAAFGPSPIHPRCTSTTFACCARHCKNGWPVKQQPKGMPSFAEFSGGIQAVLKHVRETHQGRVLIVSSGGPIATAVSHVLVGAIRNRH